MIVAIDGPSGAGKSTVAVAVAKKLGFSCLDTGAMYRAVAWRALQDGMDLEDDARLGALARSATIEFEHEADNPMPKRVCIDGADVTKLIRTAQIDKAVSPVSAAPSVREALVDQQRRIGRAGNYVVEGRDIGTVVFPDAELKIYLTATVDERARRRVHQNIERGLTNTDFDAVRADLERRDTYDSSRATSPLRPADDAQILDSTDLTIDAVVDRIAREAQTRMDVQE